MSRHLILDPPVRRSPWIAIGAAWSFAVLASALQIYAREIGHGLPVPWSQVVVANVLAWLPWLGLAPLTLAVERRFPLTGPRTLPHAALHAVAATVVSAAFLFYLSLFHLIYLEGHALPPGAAALRAEHVEKLGQFFLTAALLYATILLAGLARRAWRDRSRSDPRGAVPSSAGAPGTRSEAVDPASPPALVIRSVGRVERVEPTRVRWIEGCGNYARLHLDGRSVLLRRTLASLVEELTPAGFVRVHRSAIVNVAQVARLRPESHGEATLELQDGHRLKVSRTYRPELERRCF